MVYPFILESTNPWCLDTGWGLVLGIHRATDGVWSLLRLGSLCWPIRLNIDCDKNLAPLSLGHQSNAHLPKSIIIDWHHYLHICPSIQSIYLSIHFSINLFNYQPFYRSFYPSIHLSIHTSIYPSVNLYIHPSTFPTIHLLYHLALYLCYWAWSGYLDDLPGKKYDAQWQTVSYCQRKINSLDYHSE